MGLSERERRILDELEQQLAVEDPKLARRLAPPAGMRRRLGTATVLFVVGLVLLLSLTFDPRFGIAGAGLMLAALVLAGRAVGDLLNAARSRGAKDAAER